MKSLTEQLACARRELAMRKNVYARRVGEGRMRGDQANHETECLAGIVATLEKAVLLEEVSNEMKLIEEARERQQQRLALAGETQPEVL